MSLESCAHVQSLLLFSIESLTMPLCPAGTGSSKAKFTPQQLRGKANRELSDILKQQGLPVSGKKDDLIARILQAQG